MDAKLFVLLRVVVAREATTAAAIVLRKGFRLQAGITLNGLDAMVVARPGRSGNPFVIGSGGNQRQCLTFYRC